MADLTVDTGALDRVLRYDATQRGTYGVATRDALVALSLISKREAQRIADGAVAASTVSWCPTLNGYASGEDYRCSSPTQGLSHGHYDVEVDTETGQVLTSAAVQYERRRVTSYFVAPDADGDVWLWRGQPDDATPLLVVARHLFTGNMLVWDHLVAGLQVVES